MRYHSHLCHDLAVLTLLSFSALPTFAQQVNTQIPDSVAYTALYYVVHDAPSPHWDHDTCLSWLAERGLTGLHAQTVMFAANRYMVKHAQIESEMLILNNESRNSLASRTQARRAELEARRGAELSASIKRIQQDIGPEGAAKLAELIQNVKSRINMKGSVSK